MQHLRIRLLGDVSLVYDEAQAAVITTHATQALLAYLLLVPRRPQSREVLAEVFWGDRNKDRARRCLKTALWRLRCVLEPEGTPSGTYLITNPNGEIGFNWQSDYWLDVAVFEQAVKHALALPLESMQPEDAHQLEAAMQLYVGELLEGFYDDWALRERERLRQMYLDSLAHLMRFYHRQGAYQEALASGRKILDFDPLSEEIHRALMHLYVETGQRTLAIKQYEACRDLLSTELGILPMDETQALYHQIAPEFDRLGRDLTTKLSAPDTDLPLRQLRVTLQSLDKIHDQLWQTIQMMEDLKTSSQSVER
jgi:DNA-binding SARP family transcriptional activator